jgi:hypothetical protein
MLFSGTMAFSLDREAVGYHQLFDLAARLRSGDAAPPTGVFRAGYERGAFILLLDKRAFSASAQRLRVLDLKPIPVISNGKTEFRYAAGLLVALHPRFVNVRLKFPALNAAGYKVSLISRAAKAKPGPRLHHPAAIFVTDKVKPRVVSGGLPSLGKRR